MSAPRARPLALAALLAAGCSRPLAPAWGEGEPPPNVLLVCIDTLRADHLGCYGYERPTSPAIDALAAESVLFEDAQAASSWTLPALASLFTSTHSSTHGCWGFASALAPSFVTAAELLRDAGYDTAAIVSHVFLAPRHGLQQGCVHFDDTYSQPETEPWNDVTSPRVTAEAVRFLEQKAAAPREAPWMLFLHYFDPHDAYLPHAGVSERFGTEQPIDLYDGEIAFTDRHVGEVLRTLEATGFAGDTIVVLFSDHGEEFGEHGGVRHGHTLHRELLHVPLVMRVPGVAPRRVAERVRTIDVLPTLLELVGLPSLEAGEGSSLVPALHGGAPLPLPALAELRLQPGDPQESLIDGRWKLIHHLEREPRFELYDVVLDPREQEDLAARHPELVAELREALARLVGAAERKGSDYERPAPLDLTPTQLEHLQGLGYAGEDRVGDAR
jgi:arylsulfatase A-like enzyme